jgi:hypothetical protein
MKKMLVVLMVLVLSILFFACGGGGGGGDTYAAGIGTISTQDYKTHFGEDAPNNLKKFTGEKSELIEELEEVMELSSWEQLDGGYGLTKAEVNEGYEEAVDMVILTPSEVILVQDELNDKGYAFFAKLWNGKVVLAGAYIE